MTEVKSKYQLYDMAKFLLSKKGFAVDPYEEIPAGLQFKTFVLGNPFLIRIFEEENDVKLDLAHISDKSMAFHIQSALTDPKAIDDYDELMEDADEPVAPAQAKVIVPTEIPDDVIGLDEAGIDDYFGPMVVASVHVSKDVAPKLLEMGVMMPSESQLKPLAQVIQAECAHGIIVLFNSTYNDIFSQMQNVGLLRAWAQAKALDITLKQVNCDGVLAYHFSQPTLVSNSLLAKGKKTTLFIRRDARTHIGVAAARALAQEAYVSGLRDTSKKVNLDLPDGQTEKAVVAARKLVAEHGEAILTQIAKVHFPITQRVLGKHV